MHRTNSPKIGAVPAHAAVMERKVVCNLVNVDFGRFVRESVVAIPLHSARHLGKFSTLPFPDVESSLREISYLIA
jgi:hypothetical protein